MIGPPPGLCGACEHMRLVASRRGSTFHLCQRSATDPRYPRYPALPVLACAGFELTVHEDPPILAPRIPNSGL